MRRLASAIGIWVLMAMSLSAVESFAIAAAAKERVVRIDVGVPFETEFIDGVDFDTSVTVSADWLQNGRLSDRTRLGALWGVGLALAYQDVEAELPLTGGGSVPLDAQHAGVSGRFYAGLTYDLFDGHRLGLIGYGGAGLGYVAAEIDRGALLDDDQYNILAEYGARLSWQVLFEHTTVGLAVSSFVRNTSATLVGDGFSLDASIGQFALAGHLNLGWRY